MACSAVRYFRNYSLALLATVLLMHIVDALPGLESSKIALAFFPLLVAATAEGMAVARTKRFHPGKRVAWKAAAQMAAISVFAGFSALLLAAWVAPNLFGNLGVYPSVSVSAQLFGLALCSLLVLRIGFSYGLLSELRNQQSLSS